MQCFVLPLTETFNGLTSSNHWLEWDQTVTEFETYAQRNIDRWLAENSTNGKGKYRWVSGSARYKAIVTIKGLFNYGIKYLNLTKSPVRLVPLPKCAARVTFFTEEQQAAIVEALRLPRFRDSGEFTTFFLACIETGGRTFVEAGSFSADKLEWVDGEPVVFDCGLVKGKQRYVYLSPTLREMAKDLVKRYPTGPLFRNSGGRPWIKSTAARRLKAVVRYLMKTQPELELTVKHTLYSARHTFIVRQLILTGDVALVAEMAGNTIGVIERHYKKWGANRRRILEALGNGSTPTPDKPQLRIVEVA